MIMQCQKGALDNIDRAISIDRHSIIVTGIANCGKTYVCKQWANKLHIPDFYTCSPTVSDIRSTLDIASNESSPVVLCIENLDAGQVKAAYPLLKILEDCPNHLYISITCSNIRHIPDTIVSRCTVIDIGTPTSNDIMQFAMSIDPNKYADINQTLIWKCVRGFGDVKEILNMDVNKLSYYDNLKNLIPFKESISNISWKLQNYDDNTKTNIVIVIRYMYNLFTTLHDKRSCVRCLNELDQGALSVNAVISRFIVENKYCE